MASFSERCADALRWGLEGCDEAGCAEHIARLAHDNPSVVVKEAGDWGRGAFSTEAVPRGGELFQEPPVFVASHSHSSSMCSACFAPTAAYKGPCPLPAIPPAVKNGALGQELEGLPRGPRKCLPCSGCDAEWYCSEECRDRAWALYHRAVCGKGWAKFLEFVAGSGGGSQRVLTAKMLAGLLLAAKKDGGKHSAHVRYFTHLLATLPYDWQEEQGSEQGELERKVSGMIRSAVEEVHPDLADLCTHDAYLAVLSKMKANAVELSLGLRMEDGGDPLPPPEAAAPGHFTDENAKAGKDAAKDGPDAGAKDAAAAAAAPGVDAAAAAAVPARDASSPTHQDAAALLRTRKDTGELAMVESPLLRASAIFALQVFVNHSCLPNGHRVFYQGRLRFVAVRDVPKGEQVVMAYVNPQEPFRERQKKLRTHWHILCTCQRCASDTCKVMLFRRLVEGLKETGRVAQAPTQP